MNAPVRAAIVAEFDKLWAQQYRRPQGPDGAEIKALVAAKLGVTVEEVRTAILDDMAATSGTL